MEEIQAMLGVLLISAVALSGYFVFAQGGTGAAVSYVTCCCNILTQDTNGNQFLVRSQTQTFENTCEDACKPYRDEGHVFAQEGLCQQ